MNVETTGPWRRMHAGREGVSGSQNVAGRRDGEVESLTWPEDQVTAVKRWLVDGGEMPEVLRG